MALIERILQMNKILMHIVLLVVCSALLASCNGIVLKHTPTPLPTSLPVLLPSSISPIPTKSNFHYDWKSDWLNSPTCAPPCWEGITPGQTSLQEAIDIIKNMPGVDGLFRGYHYIEWSGNETYSGTADVGETSKTISNVVIHFNHHENISMEEAIGVFGEPLNVQINRCINGLCEVFVIYPESGLALKTTSLLSTDYTVTIDKSSEVRGLVFFTPGIANYLKIVIFQGIEVRKWDGYGTYPE
jgi:hypothetical protein